VQIAVTDLLRLALGEIRAARAGDVIGPDDQADALLLFNELLDALNVDGRAIYNRTFTTYTLTPLLQPHTIGLSANAPTFAVTIGRPKKIVAANIVLTGNIRKELELLDEQGWNAIKAGAAAGQAITITSSVPSSLFYDDGWPNGSLYLWPPPSIAYGLELLTDTLLAAVVDTDTLDLPFGYPLALRLTLAETCANSWGQPLPANLERRAREARAAVWANNDTIPNLETCDGGMPGGTGGAYDYRTGRNTL
jgi:hypothetical protein